MSDELREDQPRRLTPVLEGVSQLANIRTDKALIESAKRHGFYQRIDRASVWGNPFVLGQDGNCKEVIRQYREH